MFDIPLSIGGFLVGLFLGVVFGLNGFAQSAKAANAISQIPRVKNLIWLFLGVFTVFFADLKKLGVPDHTPLIWPALAYVLGASLGVVASIGWTLSSITLSVSTFNAGVPARFAIDPHRMRRQYLTLGKEEYDRLFQALSAASTELADQESARRAVVRQELEPQVDRLVSQCVLGALAHAGSSPAGPNGQLVERILDAARQQVLAQTGIMLSLSCSFMAFVPLAGASPALVRRARFVKGMACPYSGYLELRWGGGNPPPDVVLPVAARAGDVLPGAPTAILNQGAAIMNLRNISFARNVSKPVRDEVRAYFAGPYFQPVQSVASLLIHDGHAVRGVLNVESNARDLLGLDETAAKEVLSRLQTLGVLLAMVT